MHSHGNSRRLEFLYKRTFLFPVLRSIYQFHLSRFFYIKFCVFIYVTVCMTGNGNWFFPVTYTGFDSFYNNGSPEYRSVKNSADGSIRAFVHFFQIIFLHSGMIWSNRSAFYCNTVFFCGIGSIYGYLIVCFVPAGKPEIIIFRIQIHIGKQKFLFDHFPENTGHLISVHFYQGCCHFNLIHVFYLLSG